MKACHVLLLSLTLAVMSLGYAAVPTDLRWFAPIVGDLTPNMPVRLPLPQQVMTATQSGFTDLRLFDDQGLETPYVIYAQSVPPSSTFVFKVLSYNQSDAGDTIILQRPQDTGPFWELTVQTTRRDFHKVVHLQASHDQLTWVEMTTDVLYDFSSRIDLRKTSLAFPETDAPYLRLSLTDAVLPKGDAVDVRLRYEGLEFAVHGGPAAPFRMDQISGRVGQAHAAEHVYDRMVVAPPATRTDSQGNTLVLLGPVHLPVARVTLGVDNSYYHRRVELWTADMDQDDAYRQVASGVVYKLPGMAASDTTLRLPPSRYPYLRLTILNGDNPPLRLQQVELAWVRHNLYFIPATGRRYTLYFSAEQMRAPVYELPRLLPAQPAKLEQYAEVLLGDVQPHLHYKPGPTWGSKGQIEHTLLTIVVLILVGALGLWVYRLLKALTRVGPYSHKD